MLHINSSHCSSEWDNAGKSHMSFASRDATQAGPDEPNSDALARVAGIEKISTNLCADTQSKAFHTTLRWIIFKIVEANHGITYVQLKKILRGEYGIDKKFMDTAINSLTSRSLLNGLNKWRNHNVGAEDTSEVGIHLHVRRNSEQFRIWSELSLVEFPELSFFSPPVQITSHRSPRKASQ